MGYGLHSAEALAARQQLHDSQGGKITEPGFLTHRRSRTAGRRHVLASGTTVYV
jgi:hypothetical protein